MMAPPTRKPDERDLEIHPDAWDRFTEFVKRIAKAGPQHRTPKAKAPKGKNRPAAGDTER
jgi:hypothetical protein